MSDEKWSWWVGADDERYHTQCETRDEAVRIAKGECDGAWIIEARKPLNIRLSRYFDVSEFLDRADERAFEDHGDPDGNTDSVFDIAANHQGDLEDKIKAAIDAWQDEHGLTFSGYQFSETRNGEYIPAETEAAQ